MRSFVGVPLILNEQAVGVLSLHSHSLEAYSPAQIQTLELLSTQVAIAIQNSQLYQLARQELAERRRANRPWPQRTGREPGGRPVAHGQPDRAPDHRRPDFDQLMQTVYEQCQHIGDTDTFLPGSL